MLLFLFRLIGRQPGKSVLLSTGFLLSACALVILSAITQTTIVQSNQIISQNWRPTYDLVVLPPTVKLAAGQNVPSDYLQQYSGGISVQQYRQIKQIAGIDVAAPIAYLGYVSIPAPQIAFPNRNFAPGYYKLSWTLSAFRGVSRRNGCRLAPHGEDQNEPEMRAFSGISWRIFQISWRMRCEI